MVEAFVKPEKMFFGESAGRNGLEAGKAGFFRPDAEQAEVDGLAGVNPFLFGIELFVAMTDLIRGAVAEARGFRAVRRDLPEVEFIVEDDRSVVFRPAGDAERRFLLDRKVGLAINKGSGGSLGDVDDGVRGGVDGPKVVVAEVEEVAAAGTFLEIVIVAQAVL